MSLIKTPADLQKIRNAGRHLGAVLKAAAAATKPGVSLTKLDKQIEADIRERGCTPSFLGYEGFPNSSCLSVNERVVHGIPKDYILKEGDILGIDVGLWCNGVCVDSAVTVGVGEISPEAENLLKGTKEALVAAIAAIRPFKHIGVIGSTVQTVAEKHGLGIVHGYTGHGVGHHVHEDPEVPNQGHLTDGVLIKPGMVLAIEPMLTTGHGEVYTEIDGWGVHTVDNSLAAQFEHTVIVTAKKAEAVTAWQ